MSLHIHLHANENYVHEALYNNKKHLRNYIDYSISGYLAQIKVYYYTKAMIYEGHNWLCTENHTQ